jgi:hypothetical protein
VSSQAITHFLLYPSAVGTLCAYLDDRVGLKLNLAKDERDGLAGPPFICPLSQNFIPGG